MKKIYVYQNGLQAPVPEKKNHIYFINTCYVMIFLLETSASDVFIYTYYVYIKHIWCPK